MNVCTGDEVFARCSDGVAYVGVVKEVDGIRNEVEVRFEDGEGFWTRLSDLRLKVNKKSSTERCRTCLHREKPTPNNHNASANKYHNDLVICKECNEAFHPNCHVPKVTYNSIIIIPLS